MALQQDTSFHGAPVPEGYWRAERFTFLDKSQCRAYFALYYNVAAANANPREALDTIAVDFNYDFNDASKSVNAQAYDAAKLLPRFAGAQDV